MSVDSNRTPHWVLYVLARAEHDDRTPLTATDIAEEYDWLDDNLVATATTNLATDAYVRAEKLTDRPYKPYGYTLSDAGRELLADLGTPTHTPGCRGRTQQGDTVDVPPIEPTADATTEADDRVVGEESLAPDWDALGDRLDALGYTGLADDAYNQNLTPRDVYADGGVLDALYATRYDAAVKHGTASTTQSAAEPQGVPHPDAVGIPTCDELRALREQVGWSRRVADHMADLSGGMTARAEGAEGDNDGYPPCTASTLGKLLDAYSDAWGRTPDTSTVDATECEAMRAMSADDQPLAVIAAERNRPVDIVEHHVFGKCSHDTETEPVRRLVSATECAAMRARARDGDTITAITDDSEFAWHTVDKHVHGECSHDDSGTPAIERRGSHLTDEQCAALRWLYYDQGYSMPDTRYYFAERYGRLPKRETAKRHIEGDCQHDSDTGGEQDE